MARVGYNTRLDKDLLGKAKTLAHSLECSGANDVVEMALDLFFKVKDNLGSDYDLDNLLTFVNTYSKLKKVQIFEKELPNGKYQIVSIGNGHTCLDYVDKRINIDTVSDVEKLTDDGYYLTLEV